VKYKVLGRTGVKVSELCLGTMTFGDNFLNIAVVDQAGANQMVARSLDAGINFFDTADVYAYGQSETILGKALKDRRAARDKSRGRDQGARCDERRRHQRKGRLKQRRPFTPATSSLRLSRAWNVWTLTMSISTRYMAGTF